jgi:hypothetical protein
MNVSIKKLSPFHWLLISGALLMLFIFAVPWALKAQHEAQYPFSEDQVVRLVPSPAPGLHASLWWNGQWELRDLDEVSKLNIRWIKQIFSWREIEGPEKGMYIWDQADRVVKDVNNKGLFLLARLSISPFWSRPGSQDSHAPPFDYKDLADFCGVLANRFKGRIRAYQVWNEPNLSREWGGQPPNPTDYTRLLAGCYTAIKAVDPDAIVISAGLATTGTDTVEAMPDEQFLRGMYAAGAGQYFDMLGVDAPGYKAPPEMSPDEVARRPDLGGYRWQSFRHVEDMRRIMIEYGDARKQVAILEFGWTLDPVHPEYSWFAVSPQQQADYILGAFRWARAKWQPWIGIMIALYMADPYWLPYDEQYWWALNRPYQGMEFIPRPAWLALENLPAWDYDFYQKKGW